MASDQEILNSLRRIQEQVDQINKRCERIENNNRLMRKNTHKDLNVYAA